MRKDLPDTDRVEQLEQDITSQRSSIAETIERAKDRQKNKPQKRPPPKAPKKDDLWLEKLEAYYLSMLLQFGAFAKYGIQPEIPDKAEQEHLAHVLKRAGKVPPLSWVQTFAKRLAPIGAPGAKPGRSLLGDIAQYVYAWHKRNPEMYLVIMDQHQLYVPFINDMPPTLGPEPEIVQIPPRNQVEGKFGYRLTDEQWDEYLRTNYGVVPAQEES